MTSDYARERLNALKALNASETQALLRRAHEEARRSRAWRFRIGRLSLLLTIRPRRAKEAR